MVFGVFRKLKIFLKLKEKRNLKSKLFYICDDDVYIFQINKMSDYCTATHSNSDSFNKDKLFISRYVLIIYL